jgi:hypothetical protein
LWTAQLPKATEWVAITVVARQADLGYDSYLPYDGTTPKESQSLAQWFNPWSSEAGVLHCLAKSWSPQEHNRSLGHRRQLAIAGDGR